MSQKLVVQHHHQQWCSLQNQKRFTTTYLPYITLIYNNHLTFLVLDTGLVTQTNTILCQGLGKPKMKHTQPIYLHTITYSPLRQ